jgi:hypothetical protein
MPTYRFYFMCHGHSISLAKVDDCPGDDEARRHAIDLLEAQSHDEPSRFGSAGASLLVMIGSPADQPQAHLV